MVDMPDRFIEKVHPEPMSGCWLWVCGLTDNGYAQFYWKGKNVSGPRTRTSWCGCSESRTGLDGWLGRGGHEREITKQSINSRSAVASGASNQGGPVVTPTLWQRLKDRISLLLERWKS